MPEPHAICFSLAKLFQFKSGYLYSRYILRVEIPSLQKVGEALSVRMDYYNYCKSNTYIQMLLFLPSLVISFPSLL